MLCIVREHTSCFGTIRVSVHEHEYFILSGCRITSKNAEDQYLRLDELGATLKRLSSFQGIYINAHLHE